MEAPTTEEIDTLAVFTLVATELKACRFWMEEHQNLTYCVEQGGETPQERYGFPDQDTVAAAVLAFRKMWNEDDASHHGRTKNIICRYSSDLRFIVDDCWRQTEGVLGMMRRYHGVDIASKDVIEMWLNTRFLHVGKSRRRGRFTREDFQETEAVLGAPRFEYFFLMSMWYYGLYFRNLANIAEAFLKRCESSGLKPSVDVRPPLPSPDVHRATPGFEPSGSAAEQLCWRLRRLSKFKAFAEVAERLGVTDAAMVMHASRYGTFSSVCQALGVELVQGGAEPSQVPPDCIFFGSAVELGRIRKGFWCLTQGRQIIWSGEWLDIVEEQYAFVRAEVNDLLRTQPVGHQAVSAASPSAVDAPSPPAP